MTKHKMTTQSHFAQLHIYRIYNNNCHQHYFLLGTVQ